MNKPSYYGEGSKLPGGIDLNGSYPLDYRALINSWDAHDNTYDIDSLSFDSLYTGMIVSDSSGKVKVLKSIPSNTTKAHECTWEEIGATVNDATYSVKTDVSGTETTVSDFTANQSTADSITFVLGSNVTLTPDAANKKITINATNTTYNDFNGSVHGLVPVPSSGDTGKFLKADGSWGTPSGIGLTGVSFNGTEATVTNRIAAITASVGDANVIETVKVNGSALTPDSNKAVDITVPDNKDTTYSFSLSGNTLTITPSSGSASTSYTPTFNDRYVNLAVFADDSTSTPNSPIKMTLTRAGSDSATVTANLPKVSSTSAGVVPKGDSVSSQTQSTKFLRVDGTWAVPSYTTYNTFGASGTGHSSGLVPDPGATAGTAKFLREDGTWDTPSGNGLTGVTFNGVRATLTNGIAAIKDNEVLTSDDSIAVIYTSEKYIKKSLTGGTYTINVHTTGTGFTDNGAKEIIYRIDNSSSNATIKVTNSGTGTLINMFNSDLSSESGLTLPAGKTMELVFTFWSPTDVTFNGGIQV